MPNRGVVYVATGEDFVREATLSAETLREEMDIPVHLFTDERRDIGAFDSQTIIDEPIFGFEDKINCLPKSPFDRTLYLDTDIFIADDVSSVFSVLDEFDFCLAYNHNRRCMEVPEVPSPFPELNTGVMAYRQNENTDEVFKRWENEFSKRDPHDQPAFRTALYKSSARFAPLTPEYNLMIRYPGHVKERVKIFHGRLLDFQTPGAGEWVDMKKASAKINSTDDHRVFTHSWRTRLHTNSPLYILLRSVREYGWRYTIRSAIDKFTK